MRRLAEIPETCACDFAELFDVRQPTISQHLKVLRDSGLARTRRQGNQICYSVVPEALNSLERLVDELLTPRVVTSPRGRVPRDRRRR
jgi:ArsR family transcriptional regulator, arsenate/arsenite/antimonite-responsive transcriptional repressor